MKTVYLPDGTAVTLNPIDARERIKVGLALEYPPGTSAPVKEVLHRVAADGVATGDGTGEKLPKLPVTAYTPNGAPLVESERPVLSLRRGRPPKADEANKG